MLQLDPGVVGCELPIGFGIVCISRFQPCDDLSFEDRFVGDAAIQTLRGEYREFGFGHIEPGAVLGGAVPLETLDETSGFTAFRLVGLQ
ncbi:MAG: hypothetical protein HQL37_11820 [Alphaproteobacteria bacterium]|nr:hypothetical protein [Alphaproteobacteria bacterium]